MRAPLRIAALVLAGVVAAPCVVTVQAQRAPLAAAADSSALVRARLLLVADSTDLLADSVAAAPAVGAPVAGLQAGVHARESAHVGRPMIMPARAGLGQARAMMVVGAAALVAGAIIGGDPGTIVMVGGAVIGLVGLYDYLQ